MSLTIIILIVIIFNLNNTITYYDISEFNILVIYTITVT